MTQNLASKELVNFVSNAIAIPAGTFSRSSQQERPSRCQIYRRRHGPGNPQTEAKPDLREFTRLDEHKKSNIVGTGLGLTIAVELANAMGGSSPLGQSYQEGARFVSVRASKRLKAPLREIYNAVRPERGTYVRKKVLVADDMEFNRFIATEFFESLDAQVSTARDGEETLAQLNDSLLRGRSPRHQHAEDGRRRSRSSNQPNTEERGTAFIAPCPMARSAKKLDAGFDAFIEKPLTVEKLGPFHSSIQESPARLRPKVISSATSLETSQKGRRGRKTLPFLLHETLPILEAQIREETTQSEKPPRQARWFCPKRTSHPITLNAFPRRSTNPAKERLLRTRGAQRPPY